MRSRLKAVILSHGRRTAKVAGRRVPRPLAIATTLGFVLLTAPIFIDALDWVVDLHRDVGGWVLRSCNAR